MHAVDTSLNHIVKSKLLILLKYCMTGKTDGRPFTFSKKVQIVNELGLHARAAAIIARKARNAASTIWIVKENEKADAASVIEILTLECTKGSWIELKSDDPSNYPVLLDIVESIQSGFGE